MRSVKNRLMLDVKHPVPLECLGLNSASQEINQMIDYWSRDALRS